MAAPFRKRYPEQRVHSARRARRFDMTHQRLTSLVLSALFASACGGGDGNPSNGYNPNAPPKIADQAPVITEARPPDNTQQPGGSTTQTPTTPGGGTCESFCANLLAADCAIPEGGASCSDACAEVRAQTCPNETIALLDCALGLGICPDDIDDANSQALAASCSAQAQAFATCLSANDDNANDD
jgi:hypothetical protein